MKGAARIILKLFLVVHLIASIIVCLESQHGHKNKNQANHSNDHITIKTRQNLQYQERSMKLFNYLAKTQAEITNQSHFTFIENISQKQLHHSKKEVNDPNLVIIDPIQEREKELFEMTQNINKKDVHQKNQKAKQQGLQGETGAQGKARASRSQAENSKNAAEDKSKNDVVVTEEAKNDNDKKNQQNKEKINHQFNRNKKHPVLAFQKLSASYKAEEQDIEEFYYDRYYRRQRAPNNRDRNSRDSHKLFLYNHFNQYYTTRVSIAKKFQHFDLIVSTGMPFSYLASYYCLSKACNTQNYYDYKVSEKAQTIQKRVKIATGVEGMEGFLIQDTIILNDIFIHGNNMIQVTKWENQLFNKGEYDGILGMGIDRQVDTLINQLINERQIRRPMFSFYQNRMYLGRKSDPVNAHITFGAYDRTLSAGREPIWYPVVDDRFWTIEFEQILLDGRDTQLCSLFQPCKMGFDSFQTSVLAPSGHLNEILKSIKLKGRECIHYSRLPVITFVINGAHYPLYPEEYTITITRYGIDPIYEHSGEKDIVDCVANFIPTPSTDQMHWIMGNIFTSRYYMVFEKYYYNDKYVALAPSKFLKNKRS